MASPRQQEPMETTASASVVPRKCMLRIVREPAAAQSADKIDSHLAVAAFPKVVGGAYGEVRWIPG